MKKRNHNKLGNYTLGLLLVLLLTMACKTQMVETSAPFTIEEKVYFYWAGGQPGAHGTTVRIRGQQTSMNVSFSKIYFQNHEYEIVPVFDSHGFLLEGNFSEYKPDDMILHADPVQEYGNTPPDVENKIPFELEKDEAIIVYSVNGMEGFHKVTGMKELDRVFRP